MSDKPSSTVDYQLEIVAFYNRWIKVVKLLLKDRVNRCKFKSGVGIGFKKKYYF